VARSTDAHLREAVAVLRKLLDAVANGELSDSGATAKALLRRVEGAVAALDTVLADQP
jgi:hypothetical protein